MRKGAYSKLLGSGAPKRVNPQFGTVAAKDGVEFDGHFAPGLNTETLTATKTLVVTDKFVQTLDPGGSGRTVVLPAEANSVSLAFLIVNAADAAEDLTITDDTPTTIGVVGQNESALLLCDGTSWRCTVLAGGTASTSAALLAGAGVAGTPITTATANKNFLGYWVESTAATGDMRGLYLRAYFAGAGSGEALRAWSTVSYAGAAAVGGTINGAHITMSVNAGATISGQASGARITLGYAAATRTTDANVSALLLCSDIATGNTVHANNAFIRVVDDGAVALKKLFRLPTVASAGLLAVHTTDAITHSIRCVDEAGTVFYIMATTTATNRTGGA